MEGSESYEGQFDELDSIEDLAEFMKQFTTGEAPTWLTDYQTKMQEQYSDDPDLGDGQIAQPIVDAVLKLVNGAGLKAEVSPVASQAVPGEWGEDMDVLSKDSLISVTLDARSWFTLAMFLVHNGHMMAQLGARGMGQLGLEKNGVVGQLPTSWFTDEGYEAEIPGEAMGVDPNEEAYHYGTGLAALALVIRCAISSQPGEVLAS